MIDIAVFSVLFLLSLPAIIYVLETVALVIYYFSEEWVTVATIEAGLTEYLYLCALLESIQDGK